MSVGVLRMIVAAGDLDVAQPLRFGAGTRPSGGSTTSEL
jgi:hypothetical protein